jgi:hypothetical protein
MKTTVKFSRIIDGNYHGIEREKRALLSGYNYYKNITKGELNLLGYIRIEVNAYFNRIRSKSYIEKLEERARVVLTELVNEFDYMDGSDVRLCISTINSEIYYTKNEK